MGKRLAYFIQAWGSVEVERMKSRPLWSVTKSIRDKQAKADNLLRLKLIESRKALKNAKNQ